MNKTTMEVRIQQLKLMHELMTLANDEEIYMTWITLGVPDCPMEDDFKYIAEDDESYNETCELFAKLIADEDYRWQKEAERELLCLEKVRNSN